MYSRSNPTRTTWSPKSRRSSTDPRYDPAPAGSFFRAVASRMPPRGKGRQFRTLAPFPVRCLARFTAPARVLVCPGIVLYSECPVLPASNPLSCPFHDACACSCTFPCPDPVFRAGHCPCPLPAACAGAFSGAGKENGRKGRNTAGNYYLCSGFRRAARSRASHRELRFFYY